MDKHELGLIKIEGKIGEKRKPIEDQLPLVLHHGLGMNADSWIMHAKTSRESLPLLLHDTGYDVWIANNKGTLDYSSGSASQSKDDASYWDIEVFDYDQNDGASILFEIWKYYDEKKKITYVGYDRAVASTAYALTKFSKFVSQYYKRFLFLNPCYVFDGLPAWTLADDFMSGLLTLDPPYIQGEGWAERREKLCSDPANEILCTHPWLNDWTELGYHEDFVVNPIPVREFEVYAQQNAASRFQLPIDREKYDESGLTTELIELKKITDS
jgi:hypothetical protein